MAVKTTAFILGLFFLGLAPSASYCQEEVQQYMNMETSGTVSEIDVISGKIAVQVYDGVKLFLISDKTKITRGISTISINDIQIGDPLSIVYYIDKEGNFQVLSITDSNLAADE